MLKYWLRFIVVTVAATAMSGCAGSGMEVLHVDPVARTVTRTHYSKYFNTRTILVPDKVGLNLVVDLEKKRIPGLHQLQQSLGALGPGDLDATGLFTAYVHNLTMEPQTLTITRLEHKNQPLPALPVTIRLQPSSFEKIVLGRVGIFNYAEQLKVQAAYTDGSANDTKSMAIKRQTQNEIDESVRQWKDKKKNVPEFFSD